LIASQSPDSSLATHENWRFNEKARSGTRTSLDEPTPLLITIAAAAATAATTAAAAVITTRAAATAATAAATRAIFARACDVHRQGASVDFFAVERFDGFLGLFGCAHCDEAKTTRTSAHAIHHQVGLHDRAVRREGVVQIVFRGVEGKISYKQFVTHARYAVQTTSAFTRLFPTAGFQTFTELRSLEDFPCLGSDKHLTDCAHREESTKNCNEIFCANFWLEALGAAK
jgi:hypothetical protein